MLAILMWIGLSFTIFLVVRYCYRILGSLADADLETIRTDVYLERHAKRPGRGRTAWLLREARRIWLRRKQRKVDLVITDFKEHYAHITPGNFLKIREETIYPLARPGAIVCAAEVILDARGAQEAKPQVIVYLADGCGLARSDEPLQVAAEDLESLAPEEERTIRQEYEKPIVDPEVFQDGDPVWVIPDIQIKEGADEYGPFSTMIRVHEPLKGFIDAPDIRFGASTMDLNRVDIEPAEFQIEGKWWVYYTSLYSLSVQTNNEFRLRRKFRGPKRLVFLPRVKQYRYFDPAELKHRTYDRDMFSKVVLDEETRARLLSVAPPRNPDQLRKWGLGEGMLKHQSNCILFYGPHGTGKTLTAEALAEYLGVPFYPIDMSDIGHDIEKGFQEIAKRAKRWKAVVLWNEAEPFLEDRSYAEYEGRGVATIVLQQLEFFDGGMLIAATNHPGRIDPGFNSRFSVKIGFQLTPEKRREIWLAHLPEKMPVGAVRSETALANVAKVPIDGRQIQQAVQLAATRASNEELSEIPVAYFLEAAQQIHADSVALEKTKPDGDQKQHVGFFSH